MPYLRLVSKRDIGERGGFLKERCSATVCHCVWGVRRLAVCSQNKDGCKVQGCGRVGGGSELLWGGRVVCWCEVRCEVVIDDCF